MLIVFEFESLHKKRTVNLLYFILKICYIFRGTMV